MEKQFLYFKVPFLQQIEKAKKKDDSKQLHIVGIIDSSGSMQSCWKHLSIFWNECIPKQNLYTITFDTQVRICKENVLSENISQHGGGGTNISNAFEAFEKHLETVPIEQSITAIFISDGEDNYINTLDSRLLKLKGNQLKRKINFICLGIQQGFPTFISMRLREFYHQGDENIPALYLIEYISEQAFFNKFESMKKYFYSAGSLLVDPPVQIYPWDETVLENVYEGTWVIAKNNKLTFETQFQYDVNGKQDFTLEDIVDIIRGWVQKLQLISLNDMKSAQTYSAIALKEMNKLIDYINLKMKINVKAVDEKDIKNPNLSFAQRASAHYVFRYGNRLNWFYNAVQDLSQGKSPKTENSFEAAKQMNIGTIVGKFHQKILALKKITLPVFEQMKQDFIEVYKKSKIQVKNNDTVSDEWKKVLTQKDFLDGFEYIKSPYDLLEAFPYFGVSLKIKRFEGFQNDVWKYEILKVSKVRYNLNEFFLNQFNFKIENEEYTGLQMFFTEKDEDLIDIINTRLIKYINSFLITLNEDEDSTFEEAFLAQYSKSLQFILSKAANSKEDIEKVMRNLVLQSTSIRLCQNQQFNQQIKDMIAFPNDSFMNDKEKNLQKKLLQVFMIWQEKLCDKNTLKKIFDFLVFMFFQEVLGKYQVDQLITSELPKNKKEEIIEYLKQNIDIFPNLCDLRNDFSKLFAKKISDTATNPAINEKFLYQEAISIKFNTLENLYKYIFDGQELKKEDLIYIALYVNATKNECYKQNQFDKNPDALKDLQKKSVLIDEKSIKKYPYYTNIQHEIEEFYCQLFAKRHMFIVPLPKNDIKNICLQRQIDFDALVFNQKTQLCVNACMAPDCPLFLKPQENMRRHLGGWQGQQPTAFHERVSNNINKTPDEIYQIITHNYINQQFEEKFKCTKQIVVDYIIKVQEAYKKL